ncbi:MAG: aminotransferase class I/II-fold pyridoxal phosphate-dependent enzyme [Nitriliruptoraceae bacterium]
MKEVGARRTAGLGISIFTEMTALAAQHNAINLGQGFPDESPPEAVVAAAKAALDAGHHQYAPGPGLPALREAVAGHQSRYYDLDYDPDTEVTVTFGATEAIAAAVLALCEVGDEVIVFEPAYDAYPALVGFAGGIQKRVTLNPPDFTSDDPRWRLDVDRLEAAITPRTRVLLLNEPHNPTGMMLDDESLDAIARLCVQHDLIAITDEVYEHLTYGRVHRPLATREGMRERTVTASGAGKTFSCTGWKIGWACAPPPLTNAIRVTKQFLSFSGGTPLQHAVAFALNESASYVGTVAEIHLRRRDLLAEGLRSAGLPVSTSDGTYFLTADLRAWGHDDASEFCRMAPELLGVAAVPVAAFVAEPAAMRSIVRFAYCKPDDVIAEGVRRLQARYGHA